MAHDAKYGDISVPGIPDDEPIFILRASDQCAPQTIRQYAANADRAGSPTEHHASARRQADAFDGWQEDHGSRVKVPD